jgi:hypothetical protein
MNFKMSSEMDKNYSPEVRAIPVVTPKLKLTHHNKA